MCRLHQRNPRDLGDGTPIEQIVDLGVRFFHRGRSIGAIQEDGIQSNFRTSQNVCGVVCDRKEKRSVRICGFRRNGSGANPLSNFASSTYQLIIQDPVNAIARLKWPDYADHQMRCPYCRTEVMRDEISCPTCRARISYGCTVPATGCLLTVVVSFLCGSALIGVFSAGDAAKGLNISQDLLIGIGVFSVLLGLGLWLVMSYIAKRFVTFSRRRH